MSSGKEYLINKIENLKEARHLVIEANQSLYNGEYVKAYKDLEPVWDLINDVIREMENEKTH